ncbi:GGDEF domain-containing protein [Alkalicoccus luteus]|uniref:GGDEF domain-containing protein n=1 Tax=Alkalicoccus luteus TaxID=1237094 RepID=UPI00403362B3
MNHAATNAYTPLQKLMTRFLYLNWSVHLILMILNIFSGDWILASAHVVSTIVVFLLLPFVQKEQYKQIAVTQLVNTIVHITIGSYLVGTAAGLHLFILNFPVLTLIFLPFAWQVVLNTAAVSFFFLIFLIAPANTGYFPPTVLQTILTMNVFMIFAIFFICLLFYKRMHDQKSMEREAAERFDPLTGLFNRRWMYVQMQEALDQGKSGYLALLDLDNFKKINGELGQTAGDHALAQAAGIIKAEKTAHAMAARWGGEEFLLYFPDGDKSEVEQAVRRMALAINELPEPQGLSFTGGLTEVDSSLEQTLSRADQALVEGKQSAKNQVTFLPAAGAS